MNEVTNLFLLSTPLQLINVMEAKRVFNIPDSTAVAIFITYSSNFQALERIVDRKQWREVFFIDENIESILKHEDNFKRRKIISVLRKAITDHAKIKRFLKKLGRVDNVVVGYYLSLENLDIVNRVASNRIIVLDDGIATIETNRRRVENVSFLKNQSLEDFAKTAFKKYFLGYRIYHPPSVCFFTIYKMDVSSNDQIVRNNFDEVKKQLKMLEVSEESYFLGQPLSEIQPEILTEEEYFNYLKRTREHFNVSQLMYIPHRDEAPEKLQKLKNELNINIQPIDLPIELFLLQQSRIPKVVFGFITSALPNCKEIFGDSLEIVAVRIDRKKIISRPMISVVENTYEYFDKIADSTFKVVSVD